MSSTLPTAPETLVEEWTAVAAFLDAQHVMSVATLRPDGWPQVTSVGFLAQGTAIYFVVARESQKFQNMLREPRISLCVAASTPSGGGLDGISMAAIAEEVTDTAHIVQFDDAMLKRYPQGPLYNPLGDAMALIRAKPQVISLVRLSGGRSHAELRRLEGGRLVPA
ncbi:MAG: pyridoxamine 5'-phosphate oxidase family protein [Caulobacteraceae bacterium]|nr:pyridoxamine 5'-phosphate oxidase family protein [Caulobacteraceae bacterium]